MKISLLRFVKLFVILGLIYFITTLNIFGGRKSTDETEYNFELQCNKLNPQIDDPKKLECIKQLGFKSIQILTELYKHSINWGYASLGQTPFENCRFNKRCYAFNYTREFQVPIESSDGIIVHMPKLADLPSRNKYKRNPKQLWAFFSMEPQRYSFCDLNKTTLTDLDDWFNITQTAKTHAYFSANLKLLHLYSVYREAYERQKKSILSPYQVMERKKSKVLWFVSRCISLNKREKFVKELAKHIDVDIYGGCGKNDPCKSAANKYDKCRVDLFNSYKFYLSFENCNCEKYVTEKFFQFFYVDSVFKINILPIVMGSTFEHYKSIAPHQTSFIYAKDPKLLADHLNYLDRNDTAYLEYFRWKYDLYEKMSQELNPDEEIKNWGLYSSPLCDLCDLVHNETFLNQNNSKILLSESYNFIKDCYTKEELNANKQLTFDNLKNRCFFNKFDNDWSL